jgi:hypothetical protein
MAYSVPPANAWSLLQPTILRHGFEVHVQWCMVPGGFHRSLVSVFVTKHLLQDNGSARQACATGGNDVLASSSSVQTGALVIASGLRHADG